MKILSDFDGVWTDQALEAESVKLFLTAEAARLAGVSSDDAAAHFRTFETAVKNQPESYGWAPDGRITAFVDEDPFCVPNAIAAFIDQAGPGELAHTYREAVLGGGFESLNAFADACFLQATTRYREEHPPALVAGVAEVLHELSQAGAEVVVVSNSVSAKIVGWFREVGADAGTEDGHELRVRGRAGKQTIGAGQEAIEVAGRPIFVDRPLYRRIIEQERPDLVIGDVFSLDLALPHVMRTEGHPAAPSRLVLRRHPHTPSWVLETAAEGAIDAIVDDLAELVNLVA